MHVDVFGRGEPVLLLHGIPNPPSHLQPLAEALSDRFEVLLGHLPGFGRSAPSSRPWDLGETVSEVVEAVRSHGIRRLALVGYSFGSWIAFAVALDGRLEVTRLFGIGAFADCTSEERARFMVAAEAIRAGADLEEFALALALPPDVAQANPELAAEVRRWGHAATREFLASVADAVSRDADLLPRLEGLPLRVTLRVGDLDTATPVAKSERIVRAMPNAAVQVVPGASHVLLLEDREATFAAVRRALLTPA